MSKIQFNKNENAFTIDLDLLGKINVSGNSRQPFEEGESIVLSLTDKTDP